MYRKAILFSAVVALIACIGSPEEAANGSAVELSLKSPHQGIEAPVEFQKPPTVDADVVNLSLGDKSLLAQTAPLLFSSPGNRIRYGLCSILPAGLDGERAQVSPSESTSSSFEFEELVGGRLQLAEEGLPVLVYNFGIQGRQGVPEDRDRSSYIHPVYDLSGVPLTDDFPEDHYHHRGLSWMWPKVGILGELNDLWHVRGVYQRFDQWLYRGSGPVCATLGVKNNWIHKDQKVVEEWVWIRVYRKLYSGRAIDVSLTWRAKVPITLRGADERGYGGLCFRLAPRNDAVITTSAGKLEEDSDLQPMPWADYSGVFEAAEDTSGVAIFQHVENPDFPAGWCLRYYGFLGVSWPGMDVVLLEPNEPLTLRFRIWIHRGEMSEGQVAEAYSVFSTPPVLNLEP